MQILCTASLRYPLLSSGGRRARVRARRSEPPELLVLAVKRSRSTPAAGHRGSGSTHTGLTEVRYALARRLPAPSPRQLCSQQSHREVPRAARASADHTAQSSRDRRGPVAAQAQGAMTRARGLSFLLACSLVGTAWAQQSNWTVLSQTVAPLNIVTPLPNGQTVRSWPRYVVRIVSVPMRSRNTT